jgi:hypothetical protein
MELNKIREKIQQDIKLLRNYCLIDTGEQGNMSKI